MCNRTQTISRQFALEDSIPETGVRTQMYMNEAENQFFQSDAYSKVSFFDHSTSKKSNHTQKQQLKYIILKKRQTLATLKSIEHEEISARVQLKGLKMKSHQHNKSQFYKEDKSIIQEILRNSQIYEKNMEKRSKSIEQKAVKYIIQQKQQYANKIKSLREQRQKQAEKRIQKIKDRQKQRQNQRLQSLERQKQLQGKLYAFQKFKTVQNLEVHKQKPPTKQINMSEILEYEKKYKQATQQSEKIRRSKMIQRKKEFQKKICKQYPQGRFAQILKKQKQEEKQKEEEKLSFPVKYSNRMSEYGKIVRELYQPITRQKTQDDESKNTNKLNKRKACHSVSQLKQLGDSYLSYNKRQGAKRSRQQSLDSASPKQLKPVYKNYWKEVREAISLKSFNTQFSQLMRQQNCPDKIFKLKVLLEHYQSRHPHPNQEKLKQITDAKLSIINCVL